MGLSAEQMTMLGLLAIGVFGFMALVAMYQTARTIKRATKRSAARYRRLVSSPEIAKTMAVSLVEEVARNHPDEVEKSKQKNQPTLALEKALEEARDHFLTRVEQRYRSLFSTTVDEIIFQQPDAE